MTFERRATHLQFLVLARDANDLLLKLLLEILRLRKLLGHSARVAM